MVLWVCGFVCVCVCVIARLCFGMIVNYCMFVDLWVCFSGAQTPLLYTPPYLGDCAGGFVISGSQRYRRSCMHQFSRFCILRLKICVRMKVDDAYAWALFGIC